MGYWINESYRVGNLKQLQYFMDTDTDVAILPTTSTPGTSQQDDEVSNLPCGKGSVAFSIESGNVFVLNSHDQWVNISDTDGSES